MNFHVAAYSESLGSVTNSDVNAASDDVLQRRNSHLIFSEPFNLIAAYGSSTTLTVARFGNVALTQIGTNHIWPLDRTDTIQRYPAVMDLRHMPMQMPQNEELTIEATTDAVGPVIANFLLWLAKPQWSKNLPQGMRVLTTRATCVIAAGAASSWTALSALVMERDLLNGVYAVVGANVVAANAVAFRLFFPNQPLVGGRQLRPGGLVMNTVGLAPWDGQSKGLGEWGRFHTFEPPMLQVFEDTAGGTYEVRLELVYLGPELSLLMTGL